MTTQSNTFDSQALAESSTMRTPFHIKVDNSYIKMFDRIHSYYQSETDYITLYKHHVFKIIIDKHFSQMVDAGLIIDDVRPTHERIQNVAIDNTTTTHQQHEILRNVVHDNTKNSKIIKDNKVDVPQIIKEWRKTP